MATKREIVLEKHKYTPEAKLLFSCAEMISRQQEEESILCVHVFIAGLLLGQETVSMLLGREITRLPDKYKDCFAASSDADDHFLPGFDPTDEDDGDGEDDGDDGEMDFAEELAAVFLEDAPGSPIQSAFDYNASRTVGIPEIMFSLLMEPTEEIADILLENEFSNNAAQFGNMIRDNYILNSRNFTSEPVRERLRKASIKGLEFKEYMSGALVGQKEAIQEVSSLLTNFWFKGNDGKPLSIILLSKTNGGRSFFARKMQEAFVRLGLQNRADAPLDMCGFMNESSTDPDLLGDAKSFRNARCGKLYEMANSNRRGVLVFEDVLEGCRTAKHILRSFATNLAYDKYQEEILLIPHNVLVFTLKLTDDQYRFIKERNTGKIDAKLLNKLFFETGNEKRNQDEKAAKDANALWQCASRIILLEQLTENELAELAERHLKKIENELETECGIMSRYNDLQRFISMFVMSSPDELGPGELVDRIDNSFRPVWQHLNNDPDIEKIEFVCEELPEYKHDPARRLIRGDYLAFTSGGETEGTLLRLTFRDIHYAQQERVDCGEYRIERPKGITFRDIVGLDAVRDELLDSLNYIASSDDLIGKAPAPCLNFILYGPPGTGKTSLSVALANSADVPVFFATSSIFTDEKKLGNMFRKAKSMAPAIVVLDEFNSIGDSSAIWKRDAINELLSTLDGAQQESKLLVLACTNHPDQIEKALLRPGRFGRQIEIGLPTSDARNAYVLKFAKEYGISLNDDLRKEFVTETDGSSLADIKGVLGYALRTCIKEHKTLDSETLTMAIRQFKKPGERVQIGFIRENER